MSDPLSFARCPAVVLIEIEADNMTGNWTDYIVATRTKSGVYSVLSRKYYEDHDSGRYKYKMGTLHIVKDVKNPLDFVSAVLSCADSLDVDVEWKEVLDKLASLDAAFSKQVAFFVDKL